LGGVAQEALFRQKFDRFDKDKDNTVARKDLKDLIAALDIPVGFKKRVALADKMDPDKTGACGAPGSRNECVCVTTTLSEAFPFTLCVTTYSYSYSHRFALQGKSRMRRCWRGTRRK